MQSSGSSAHTYLDVHGYLPETVNSEIRGQVGEVPGMAFHHPAAPSTSDDVLRTGSPNAKRKAAVSGTPGSPKKAARVGQNLRSRTVCGLLNWAVVEIAPAGHRHVARPAGVY